MLNCIGMTGKSAITLTGSVFNTSLLALSNDENSATGVGIQLLMNGKEIAGFNDNVATIAEGDNLVNFEAKDYQTAETVTPGSADPMVVLNVFYN